MGMYTELIFEGTTMKNISKHDLAYLEYFFADVTEMHLPYEKPNHPFFKTPRWNLIGLGSSYYHLPMPVRRMFQDQVTDGYHVFLRCDLKNYDDEIQLFINWIKPLMQRYRGWTWYEEDEEPQVISYHRCYD